MRELQCSDDYRMEIDRQHDEIQRLRTGMLTLMYEIDAGPLSKDVKDSLSDFITQLLKE